MKLKLVENISLVLLLLMFNDFIGNPLLSFNLGGIITISDVNPMTLSRAPIMVAQDVQPNLFFRDFFVDGFASLQAMLQSALPLYNINNLNITTSQLGQQILSSGDVTTQIGEKFLATTNNIQKVTFLLSVQNLTVGQNEDLEWNGDLVVSIYPLQSGVICPTDVSPLLPIDFSPNNIPVAQISFNYSTLQDVGVVLDSVPQPVDFVFSNTAIAGTSVIVPGSYYAITLKRSGADNKCDILIATGASTTPNSRITIFSGSLWVDIPEQQLWFKVWTDSAKVSDGQAYDSGDGIVIPKTIVDPTSQLTVDFSQEGLPFFGNDIFRAVVSASTQKSVPVPDQRTGNPILSRQQFVPSINLLNTIDITNLEAASEPLLIGAITDKNIKFYDSISSLINCNLYSSTFVNNELIIKIIDDPTDTTRFDTSVIALQTNLLNGYFQNAEIIPDGYNTSIFYRIADAKLCTMILGDVNGDGIVDDTDLNLLNTYIGYDLTTAPPLHTQITTDGYHTQFTNGYLTYTQPFTNQFSLQFQLVDPTTNSVVADGYDGVLIANPSDGTLAQFTSASVLFSAIVGVSTFKLVVFAPGVDADNGGFSIVSLDSVADIITIRKIIVNGDTISQMLRADIDGDFHITNNDGYLLTSYVNRVPLTTSFTSTYPAPATNAYTNIGTTFNIIRFKLEKFVDRNDDYTSNPSSRATTVHADPDIFSNDGYLAQHNFTTSPVPIIIEKELTWDDSLVVTSSQSRLVPTIFSFLTSTPPNDCSLEGIQYNVYATPPVFDAGKVDYFVPDNLIIGNGEIQRPDGYFYKVDFEVGTIILEIPDGLFGSERTINILDDFISDYTGSGITRLGFPAMRFADCSTVKATSLAADQVRFSVAVQSFSPNTNGLSPDGNYGAIVDGKMGVSIDYSTGLLTLNFTNLYQDSVLQSLSTKIQINVFLKKGGFNNQPLFVDSTKVQNMLKLISVFSGAVDGGPSALVDLSSDTTGVLPILHGGTGLNGVGVAGTVLTSNGSSLSYEFLADIVSIGYSSGISSAGEIPKTDGYGLLDPSFYYKNPLYIYGNSCAQVSSATTPTTIGALSFRFDSFILEGLQSITLEALVSTSSSSVTASIGLIDDATGNPIELGSSSAQLTTNSTTIVMLRSVDIKSQLSTGAEDFIYEIKFYNSSSTPSTCWMTRLVLTYNNPVNASPPLANSYNFVPYLP